MTMEGTMTVEERPSPCPRCRGRMLPDGSSGDSTCFTCGHVIYALPAELVIPGERLPRRPTHGGQSLA